MSISSDKARSPYELIVHSWDLGATKNGGDWTVCAKFGLTRDHERREVLDLLEMIRVRIELPDVRELIRRESASEFDPLFLRQVNELPRRLAFSPHAE